MRRPVQPWSPRVHEVLRHLEEVGFPYAPRFLGIDDDGREVLTYLAGDSGAAAWARVVTDEGLTGMARLLREYHEAVRGFRPVATMQGDEVMCHGDFGPWNLVWHGNRPVGILDWDYARPARPVFDVAYALEYVVPFRDDETCLRWHAYVAPPDRRRRLETFAAAYGIGSDGLVDEVFAQQQETLDLAQRLADEGRQPQLAWREDGTLDATAARIRWAREHRHLME